MEPAIKVESVAKRYVLGADHTGNLSQRLESFVRKPFRRGKTSSQDAGPVGREEFWALRDVSLEIQKGEVLGIIGANGSGKSTLLKLLSQITAPTEGLITIDGRVGTLLEVGTGFHPELTGRENVYLNGAILGMRRAEIEAKFDEILEFSGIEQFIDTPVKRYSSGMYVRLAFAVAAHLEPEILLVDEVLAVGDAEFQRKCLGKMDEVAKTGRTVVFVSHSLSTVQRLCSRAVWLHKGELRYSGVPQDVIAHYFEETGPKQLGGAVEISRDAHRGGTGEVLLSRAALKDENGELVEQLRVGQPWTLELNFDVLKEVQEPIIYVALTSADGNTFGSALSIDQDPAPETLSPGTWKTEVSFDIALLPGDFTVDVSVNEGGRSAFDMVEHALSFTVVNVGHGDTPSYPWPVTWGYFRPTSRWSVPRRTDADADEPVAPVSR